MPLQQIWGQGGLRPRVNRSRNVHGASTATALLDFLGALMPSLISCSSLANSQTFHPLRLAH